MAPGLVRDLLRADVAALAVLVAEPPPEAGLGHRGRGELEALEADQDRPDDASASWRRSTWGSTANAGTSATWTPATSLCRRGPTCAAESMHAAQSATGALLTRDSFPRFVIAATVPRGRWKGRSLRLR